MVKSIKKEISSASFFLKNLVLRLRMYTVNNGVWKFVLVNLSSSADNHAEK